MSDKDFKTDKNPVEDVQEEEKVGEPKVEEPLPVPTIEKSEVEKTASAQPLTLVSNLDAYIANRMVSQPKTLDEIALVKEKKYTPGFHRLSLPKGLGRYKDKFSFRWINKHKRAIDEAYVKGWVLVNKALFPDVEKHLFTTSGGIEEGDVILGFMSANKAEAIRTAPGIKSNRLMASNPMISEKTPKLNKGQSGFYIPEDSGSDKEEEGYQEGRDF